MRVVEKIASEKMGGEQNAPEKIELEQAS
jgi:hypothetical protein